jgi:putative transposase
MSESYRQKKRGEREKSLSINDISKALTNWKKEEDTAWLGEVSSVALSQSLQNLKTAFDRFYKKISGYPKYHKRFTACAIRFHLAGNRCPKMVTKWHNKQVQLPSIGNIKIAQPERLPNQYPKMITMSRDACGRYFISFMVEVEQQTLSPNDSIVGVDLGVKTLAVYSTGEQVKAHQALKKLQRRLKHLQRCLSRKVGSKKGQVKSNRYKKQQARVNRVHCRISDSRHDSQHKLTHDLTYRFGIICLEDLNVKGMMTRAKNKNVAQKRGLNRGIANAGFGEIRRQIEYKAKWRGREVFYANRWAPTSRTCNECGTYQQEFNLSMREWTCPDCGTHHDRDLNATKNIVVFATGLAPEAMVGQTKSNARGGIKRLNASGNFTTETTEISMKREPKKFYQINEVLPNEVGHRGLV